MSLPKDENNMGIKHNDFDNFVVRIHSIVILGSVYIETMTSHPDHLSTLEHQE